MPRRRTRSSRRSPKRSEYRPTPEIEAYVEAMVKSIVVLDRDEARALYAMTKDAALPLEGYAVTVRAIRKLGAAE